MIISDLVFKKRFEDISPTERRACASIRNAIITSANHANSIESTYRKNGVKLSFFDETYIKNINHIATTDIADLDPLILVKFFNETRNISKKTFLWMLSLSEFKNLKDFIIGESHVHCPNRDTIKLNRNSMGATAKCSVCGLNIKMHGWILIDESIKDVKSNDYKGATIL